jgi:hypothetical protein
VRLGPSPAVCRRCFRLGLPAATCHLYTSTIHCPQPDVPNGNQHVSYSAEIFGSSIVLVGSFNPAIFTPDWLEQHKLIGSGDADYARTAENLLVSHQVTVCETEWFALQVLENQFSLTSKGALSHAFQDLAESMASLVPHTPVTALGLNFLGHYKLATEAEYHRVGDVLVPKNIWSELFDPNTEAAGMADVTVRIQHAKRGEQVTDPDELRIQVQPSSRVKFGVFLSCNNHREWFARKPQGKANAEGAAEVISAEWEPAWHRAESIFDVLLTKTAAA